eukprot:TRINITY_DN3461_c0_g1_i2.p1 TRINITY_DN3461_c0_g1~~TRINITY_DN3461_c0_g1_i2.p1  ORF type:complete len:135 (+),score=41.40 TRINITY_DN3461_c0_g1_i2:108-512(+)
MQSTSNDQTNTTITGADPVEELAASAVAIRGKSVSGRTWKKTTKRASSQINVKPLRSSWQKKVSEKERLKQVKLHENLLKEAVRQQKEEERARMEERRKRKEENEKKSSVVQVIRDTKKIKRMSRKQLKQLEKR